MSALATGPLAAHKRGIFKSHQARAGHVTKPKRAPDWPGLHSACAAPCPKQAPNQHGLRNIYTFEARGLRRAYI